MKNKSKFDSLRRLLFILTFTLLTAFYSIGQDGRTPITDGGKIKPYPNPATTYITFDLQKSYQKGMTLVVYNFLGKKMYESQNIPEKTTLTLTDFNRGVYIYHFTDQGGKVIDTGKFQVAR